VACLLVTFIVHDSVGLSLKVGRTWRARSRESVEPGGCNFVRKQFDSVDLGVVTSFHVEHESGGSGALNFSSM
jgi:hypothetical protein